MSLCHRYCNLKTFIFGYFLQKINYENEMECEFEKSNCLCRWAPLASNAILV